MLLCSLQGPLAQLVERHVYTVDVIGSSPVGPTRTLGSVMDNERSQWHSDDELASALERALEETHTGTIPVVAANDPIASPVESSIGDLFAALVDEPTATANENASEVVLDETVAISVATISTFDEQSGTVGSGESREQVFESLDDFKPRTNFIPVVESAPVTAPVAPTSSQVTMPVQWTPSRPSFDEVVFGLQRSAI